MRLDKLDLSIGVILSVLAAKVQFGYQKDFYDYQENRKMVLRICESLDSRIHRNLGILAVSGSSLFAQRWDEYIYEVIYP